MVVGCGLMELSDLGRCVLGSEVVSGYFRGICFGTGLVFACGVGCHIVYVVFQVGFWVLDGFAGW